MVFIIWLYWQVTKAKSPLARYSIIAVISTVLRQRKMAPNFVDPVAVFTLAKITRGKERRPGPCGEQRATC